MVADLSKGDFLPSALFDCILLIQTLHLVDDVSDAIRTIHRFLKTGGVVLATFPGIGRRSRDAWSDSWCWNFTSLSARRLLEQSFPADGVTVEPDGNVLAMCALLYGLVASELSDAEPHYVDGCYEALLTVRAVKSRQTQ
jgi:SAM-dependent methyltransferase